MHIFQDEALWHLFFGESRYCCVWIETDYGNLHGEFDNFKDFYLKIFSGASPWNWDHGDNPSGRKYKKMYVNLNAVIPYWIPSNQINFFRKPGEAVCDRDVPRYEDLFVDIDAPDKPSTDKQLKATMDRSEDVKGWFMEKLHFQTPMIGMSGNGTQLFFKLPPGLSMDTEFPESKIRIKAILRAAFLRFSDKNVKVDPGTFSPSARMKLWGTMVRSGRETKNRPYRMCHVIEMGDQTPMSAERAELINEAMEQRYPIFERSFTVPEKVVDTEAVLNDYVDVVNVKYAGPIATYILAECPRDSSHGKKGEVAVIHDTSKYKEPIFQCKHESCQGFGWKEFKAHYGIKI